jgi:hypothetical protein
VFDDQEVIIMQDQSHEPRPKSHPDHKLDIIVADGEGDTAHVTLNEHEHLAQLLRQGLKALLGEPVPDPGDYDLLIGGTPISDLSVTLADAGLEDGAEVVIMSKDVSRG